MYWWTSNTAWNEKENSGRNQMLLTEVLLTWRKKCWPSSQTINWGPKSDGNASSSTLRTGKKKHKTLNSGNILCFGPFFCPRKNRRSFRLEKRSYDFLASLTTVLLQWAKKWSISSCDVTVKLGGAIASWARAYLNTWLLCIGFDALPSFSPHFLIGFFRFYPATFIPASLKMYSQRERGFCDWKTSCVTSTICSGVFFVRSRKFQA